MMSIKNNLLLIIITVLTFTFISCPGPADPPSTYYTVSFESNNGSTVPSRSVISGGKTNKPADPKPTAEQSAQGYVFDGWYTDSGVFVKEWNFAENTVKGNVTLYAEWVVPATFENLEVKLGFLDETNADSPARVKLLAPCNINKVWGQINTKAERAKKYLTLDLSDCTAEGDTIKGKWTSPSGNDINVIMENQYIKCIVLPSTLETIGWYAFSNCEYLTSVMIPEGVTDIEGYAFSGCISLKAIEVDPANSAFSSVDGVLFSKDEKTLIKYPALKDGTEYSVPNGVTAIETNAFADNKALTNVTVMKNGEIQQSGSPFDLYNYPSNKFVAGLIGLPPVNFLSVKVLVEGGSVVLDEGSFKMKPAASHAESLKKYVGKGVFLGIRPEDLVYAETYAENAIRVSITAVEVQGTTDIYLWTETPDLVARTEPPFDLNVGGFVYFVLRMEKARYFDKETGLSVLAPPEDMGMNK